jgi:AcrR family transcriptional regulator
MDRDTDAEIKAGLVDAAQAGARKLTDRFEDSERWRNIIDAAARMFASRGYEATSIQHIADEVGITKGSIYHYIDSKDDLLFHVILEIHEQHLQHFENYADTPGGPIDRLRAFIEGHVRVNIDDIERGSIFYLNFESLSEGRRELILRKRRKFDAFVRELLRQAKNEGSVRADVDTNIAAIGILTALNSLYLWWDADRNVDIDVPRQFADLFISGVATTPSDLHRG